MACHHSTLWRFQLHHGSTRLEFTSQDQWRLFLWSHWEISQCCPLWEENATGKRSIIIREIAGCACCMHIAPVHLIPFLLCMTCSSYIYTWYIQWFSLVKDHDLCRAKRGGAHSTPIIGIYCDFCHCHPKHPSEFQWKCFYSVNEHVVTILTYRVWYMYIHDMCE